MTTMPVRANMDFFVQRRLRTAPLPVSSLDLNNRSALVYKSGVELNESSAYHQGALWRTTLTPQHSRNDVWKDVPYFCDRSLDRLAPTIVFGTAKDKSSRREGRACQCGGRDLEGLLAWIHLPWKEGGCICNKNGFPGLADAPSL